MELITIGILVVIIGVLLTVMKIRGRETDDWADDGAWDNYQDIINTPMAYDSAPTSSSNAPEYSPPSKPSDNLEGQWRDGYEVLEYPSESGSWWYRDGQTGQWMEWR